MCGICGIVGFNDKKLLKRMCEVVSHRGPNDKGIFIDNEIGLGNQRLSIIDILGGHQPIHNEDETIWTTYNGEIYNFNKLRKDLEKRGHHFYTSSDTEVVVHAYEEFGDSCVHEFRGMFAFAIWDSTKKRLLLARDRLGIKPLYYTSTNGIFLFGSEIKSILQYEEIVRSVNYRALYNFLTFRFVPAPDTMFRGIKKLLPGSILTIKNGKIRIQKYWSPKAIAAPTKPETYYIDRLREILRNSIQVRLMSDVPLGAYLSGGVDSSSIVGMMSSIMDTPVETFSVGFGEGGYVDELVYARKVAEYFGTNHHEFLVDESSLGILPEVVWHFDEPLADPAAIPTYLISELAKKHVTVVLTGEGADEIFAGYLQYKLIVGGQRYLKPLPRFFKNMISGIVRIAPSQLLDRFFVYSSALGEGAKDRFSKYVTSLNNKGECYLSMISIFNKQEIEELCTNGFLKENQNLRIDDTINHHLETVHAGSLLHQFQLMEIETELPDDLLMKVDKMTLANSVEARVPYLDHKLVEFSFSIPESLKIRGLTEKYILRKAMSDFLPKGIGTRKKHRFFVPIDSWIENNSETISQILSEETIRKRGYFKSEYIRRMIRRFQRSKLYFSRQIWSLLTFELWHRIFMDSDNLYNPSLSKLV